MSVMFDPYRRLLIHYPSNPTEKPMRTEQPDLKPLQLQIETTLQFFAEAQRHAFETATTAVLPLAAWNKLCLAMYDLDQITGRTL